MVEVICFIFPPHILAATLRETILPCMVRVLREEPLAALEDLHANYYAATAAGQTSADYVSAGVGLGIGLSLSRSSIATTATGSELPKIVLPKSRMILQTISNISPCIGEYRRLFNLPLSLPLSLSLSLSFFSLY